MTSRKPDEQDLRKGRELARLRVESRLKQDEVGARIGVTGQQIGKYERGLTRIPVGRYEALLEVYRPALAGGAGFAEQQSVYMSSSIDERLLRQSLREIMRSAGAMERAARMLKQKAERCLDLVDDQ